MSDPGRQLHTAVISERLLNANRQIVKGPFRTGTTDIQMDSDAEPDITDNLLQQQDADSDAEMPMRKAPAKKSAPKAKAGTSFEGLSLSTALLKTLHQRGFRTPTPIQRLAMPAILDSPPRDVVGMARTGSGKTLAYMVPLIQRLGSKHSPTFGARALVLLPTRELALQVLKVGKDISRGAKEANHESLRWGMVVGGEGLDEQFDTLASNPDV
jgi:ATP-dependent RNA helicase DDX54/DBP10